jgi:hypothetical protein
MKARKNIILRALLISSLILLTALSSAHAVTMNYTGGRVATGTNGKDGAVGAQGPEGPAGLSSAGSFPYSNTCGISGTDPCKIGAVGPGGGWIFFVDYYDQYPGFTYLEAAPTDIEPVVWCDKTTTSITAVARWSTYAVGRGQANTAAMLGVCTSGAANAAESYLTATKSDWFLPSRREFTLLYKTLVDAGVGGFADGYAVIGVISFFGALISTIRLKR